MPFVFALWSFVDHPEATEVSVAHSVGCLKLLGRTYGVDWLRCGLSTRLDAFSGRAVPRDMARFAAVEAFPVGECHSWLGADTVCVFFTAVKALATPGVVVLRCPALALTFVPALATAFASTDSLEGRQEFVLG